MPEREHTRTLDEEGIPDLQGPLPEKEATGDPQEGGAPPSEVPASLDYGTTAREEHDREPLDRRLTRELPDVRDPSEDVGDHGGVVLIEEDEGAATDNDADMAARGADPGLEGLSAEESAVRIEAEAPGATTDDDPGYVDS
jgi:hypothetical protein